MFVGIGIRITMLRRAAQVLGYRLFGFPTASFPLGAFPDHCFTLRGPLVLPAKDHLCLHSGGALKLHGGGYEKVHNG